MSIFDEDLRPAMTEKELSFHTVQAAGHARAAAEAAGTPPDARHAIATAAAAEIGGGGLRLGGITTGPVSLAVLWTVDLIEPWLAQQPASPARDQAVLAVILQNPVESLAAALEGRFDAVHRRAVDYALTGAITADDAARLDLWYESELRRLRHLTGTTPDLVPLPGKPPAASSP